MPFAETDEGLRLYMAAGLLATLCSVPGRSSDGVEKKLVQVLFDCLLWIVGKRHGSMSRS